MTSLTFGIDTVIDLCSDEPIGELGYGLTSGVVTAVLKRGIPMTVREDIVRRAEVLVTASGSAA